MRGDSGGGIEVIRTCLSIGTVEMLSVPLGTESPCPSMSIKKNAAE